MAFHAEIFLLAMFPARIWTHTGHLPVNDNTQTNSRYAYYHIINKRKTKKNKKSQYWWNTCQIASCRANYLQISLNKDVLEIYANSHKNISESICFK